MIPVLHGTWVPNIARFFLWGEAAARTARRGRQAQVPMHPFQFTNDALHERLAELPSSATIPAERELTIWLPSAGGAPLPLREQRAAGAEVSAEAPTLAPWRVRGLLLEPQQAFEALLTLGDQRDAGTDLRVWRSAALLVLELVAGQQFLPALVRDGQRLRAVWQPRPTPVTARKFAALARALPPLWRLTTNPAQNWRSLPRTSPPPNWRRRCCVVSAIRPMASRRRYGLFTASLRRPRWSNCSRGRSGRLLR